jgi:hypothetical protein
MLDAEIKTVITAALSNEDDLKALRFRLDKEEEMLRKKQQEIV